MTAESISASPTPSTNTPSTNEPLALTGRVVRPGDAGYPDARAGWNRLFEHEPAVIVFARHTDDVVRAVAWARHHDVDIRVRSGRHCLQGWSNVDGGLVIDVSELKSVTVDAASCTATVGAGLTQLEAVTALGAAGVVAPTGTEGTVGLVGATLGGGFGLLTRAFGMASDHLLAVEIVVASDDGGARAIVVDDRDGADLLWALRGAGNGNFGVVTALTYRVHPLSQTGYLTATWSGLTHLVPVFEAWQRTAPHADDRLTSQLEITRDQIALTAVLADGAADEARLLLAPLLAIGDPDLVTTDDTWARTYAAFQIPTDDEPSNWRFESQFVDEPFGAEAIEVIGAFLAKAPTAHCNYFTNAFGGAVARSAPAGGSVFAHRDALFYAEPGAGWGTRGDGVPAAADPLTDPCLTWIADFADALSPWVGGAYVNVPNARSADWPTAYWGAGVDRLRAVKAIYDPSDVFRHEQSVPLP